MRKKAPVIVNLTHCRFNKSFESFHSCRLGYTFNSIDESNTTGCVFSLSEIRIQQVNFHY